MECQNAFRENLCQLTIGKENGLGKDFGTYLQASLLARRWESALLVNVDNNTLQRLMNSEDASLEYIGINKHEGENIGLYDTVLSDKDYLKSFVNVD